MWAKDSNWLSQSKFRFVLFNSPTVNISLEYCFHVDISIANNTSSGINLLGVITSVGKMSIGRSQIDDTLMRIYSHHIAITDDRRFLIDRLSYGTNIIGETSRC